MSFRITWEIDVEADSPVEAIKQAIAMMPRDEPGNASSATVFTVDGEGYHSVIDVDPDFTGHSAPVVVCGDPLP